MSIFTHNKKIPFINLFRDERIFSLAKSFYEKMLKVIINSQESNYLNLFNKKFLKSKNKEFSFSYGITSIPHLKKRNKGGEDCFFTNNK